jgi:predicted transcriptional regulator
MKSNLNQLTRQLKKYELNQTEEKVFNHILKHSEKSVRDIESDFRMSRTRVTYTLSKLYTRGLLAKTLIGKKYVYKVRKDTLENIPEVTSIEDVLHTIRNAKHTKLYGIQSDGAVSYLIKSMEKDSRTLEKIHRVQKQRSVIIETLLSQKSLKQIQKIAPRLKKSHSGRPSVFYVTEHPLKGKTDIYFDQTTVYVVDYERGQATILQNTQLSLLMIELFNIIKLSTVKLGSGSVY